MKLNGTPVDGTHYDAQNPTTREVRIVVKFLDATTAKVGDIVTLPSGERRAIEFLSANTPTTYFLSHEII